MNKLCPQKFDILVTKFQDLQIENESELKACMELVFEKVTNSLLPRCVPKLITLDRMMAQKSHMHV